MSTGGAQPVSVRGQPGLGSTPLAGRRISVVFPDVTVFNGPVTRVNLQIMRHLDPQAFDVTFIANRHGDPAKQARSIPHLRVWTADLMEDVQGAGVRRRARAIRAGAAAIAGMLTSAWRVRRLRPDIIHGGMTVRTVVFELPLAWAGGAKLVAGVHVDPLLFTGWKRRLFKASFQRADMIIAVSEWVRGRVIQMGIDPSKVRAILNVVDLDRFRPENSGARIREEYGISDDALLVVLLARLFPWKGQGDLIEAIARVREQVPSVRALIIGWDDVRRSDGTPYSETLRARRAALGLEDVVVIDKARPEAPEIMAAADIVAVPSTEDPCPLTVLEAMASGKPVVGYRSGGISEELGARNAEWIVEPGDIDGLAERLLRLAQDAGLRASVGRRNRERAEHYFYEPRLAADYGRAYRELLDKTRAPKAIASAA